MSLYLYNIYFYHWLCFLLIIVSTHIQAQTPVFTQLSTENGLPSNTVYDIHEDQRGFIWIGCDAGLFRYNGTKYIQYTHPNLKVGGMTDIVEDSQGRIYAVNFNKQVVVVENDTLKVLELDGWDASYRYWHIEIDDNDVLWGTNSKEICTYNYQNKKQNCITFERVDKKNNNYYDFSVSNQKDIYIHNGLLLWDSSLRFLYEFGEENVVIQKSMVLSGDTLHYYFYQADGFKSGVFACNEGLGYESTVNNTRLINYLNNNQVTKAGIIHDELLWFGTFYGIAFYNPEKDSTSILFEDYSVSDMMVTSDNTLLLSTLNNGILRVVDFDKVFFPSSDILNKHISHLELDTTRKVLWFGIQDNLVASYDINKSEERVYMPKWRRDIEAFRYIYEHDALFMEKDKYLYQLQVDRPFKQTISTYSVKDLYLLGDTMITGSSGAIQARIGLIDTEGNFTTIPNKKGEKYILLEKEWGRNIRYIEDQQTLVIATNNGVFYIQHRGSEVFEQIQHLFVNRTIMHLAQVNKSDTLYALTRSGEVFKIEGLKHESLFQIDQEHLIANHIFLQAPYLAITTNQGLYIYNENTHKLEHFTIFDGLLSDELHDAVIMDDILWLATSKGLQSMPFPITKSYTKPRVYLDRIRVNDSLVRSNDSYLNLRYNDKLQVDVEAVAYHSQQSYQYAYRLLPHDTSWTYINAITPRIIQERLPSGTFTLECYAVDHEGIWSEEGILIQGYVTAPYWQRWWFYLLSGGVVALLSFIIARQRIQVIKRRQAKELAMLDEMRLLQLKTIRSQMNPHFTFNVLNSIQSYIYKNDKEKASKYLTEFSMLMRKVLDLSNQETVLLAEELELLKLYISLEAMQMPNDFSYEIIVAKNIDVHDIMLPLLLIQPYVENAIKHGLHNKMGDKKLYLGVEWRSEDVLQIIIEDNGIGRAAAAALKKNKVKKHTSFATQANKKRLQLVNQKEVGVEIIDKKNAEDQAQGTKVMLTIEVGWD